MSSIFHHLLRRPVLDEMAQLAHRPELSKNIDHRSVHVAILLSVVAALNLTDLAYTLFAQSIGMLHEQNPIAASLIEINEANVLICYKMLMLLAGTFLLWKLRHRALTVAGCWILIAVYVGLAAVWWQWSLAINEIFQLSTQLAAPFHR